MMWRELSKKDLIRCFFKALRSSSWKMVKRNRAIYQAVALVMVCVLVFSSGVNLPIAFAEADSTIKEITAISPLDESIAIQNLEYGASEDDIVFPDSINVVVDTKQVLTPVVTTTEEDLVEDTEEVTESEETTTEEPAVEETTEETTEESDSEEEIPAENNIEVPTEEITPVETEESAPAAEPAPAEPESEPAAPETPAESAPAESAPAESAPSESGDSDVVSALIDFLFPAMVAQASELDDSEPAPAEPTSEPAPAAEPVSEPEVPAEEASVVEQPAQVTTEEVPVVETPVTDVPAELTETPEVNYAVNTVVPVIETVEEVADGINTVPETTLAAEQTLSTNEITITGITWTLDPERSTQAEFDSTVEGAKYTYVANIPAEYVVNVSLPTITVIIGTNTDVAFEQSVVIDGVLITVKADPGVFPADAKLSARRATDGEKEVAEDAVDSLVDSESEEKQSVITSYVFDISILDGEEKEIQPDTTKGEVYVSFTMAEVADEETFFDVYHISDIDRASEVVEKLSTEEEGSTVEAETKSFSPFVVQLRGTSGDITIENNGYPYGENMESSVTLKVDVTDIDLKGAETGSYKWYVSSNGTSDYAEVSNTANTFAADATTIETTLSSSQIQSGKWYKIRFFDNEECESMPVQLLSMNSRYYISNGQMGYSAINGTKFDVIGKYSGTWVTRTSYDGYWNWYTSTSSDPSPLSQSGTRPSSSADIKKNRCYFYENDYDGSQNNSQTSGAHALLFDTTLGDNVHAFSFGCDVMIRSNDSAPCMGVFSNGLLKQIQLIDAPAIDKATGSSAALVVRTDIDFPSKYYIGHWSPRYMYDFATKTNNTSNNSRCTFDEYGHATMITGADSGITVSWTGLEGGTTIGYAFNLGTVAQTGAVTGDVDYAHEQIKVDKVGTTYEVKVVDTNGSTVDTYIVNSDSGKGIPLSGTDTQGKDYDLCGKKVEIKEYQAQNQRPATLNIQPRPLAEDADADGTEDDTDARRPMDVGDDVIVTTLNTITLNLDSTNSTRMLQEYRIYDKDGNEIEGQGWVTPGSNGKVTFTGLEKETDYIIKARVPANVNTPSSSVSQGVHARTKGTVEVTLPAADESFTYDSRSNTYKFTYDGRARDLQVTATPNDATVTYSLDEADVYTNNIPVLKNAGEYTVYYKATKDNYRTAYGSFKVQIGKQESASFMVYADEPITISAAALENGQATLTSQIAGLRADDTVSLLNDGWNPPYSEEFDNIITDIAYNGDTVYYSVNESTSGITGYIYLVVDNANYSEYILVVPVVTHEDYTVEVPSEEDTTTAYDGQPHSYPVTVDIDTVEISYSDSEDGQYTSDVPVFTEEGEYEVFYKIVKNGVVYETGSYIVKITPAPYYGGSGSKDYPVVNLLAQEPIIDIITAMAEEMPEVEAETEKAVTVEATDDAEGLEGEEELVEEVEENTEKIPVREESALLGIGEGTVIVTLEYKGDDSRRAGLADANQVANSILTEEQRAMVAAGSILEIKVEVTPMDKRLVPELDRQVIDNGTKEYAEQLPDLTMADYVDISLFFRIDESDWNQITETDPIDIVIDIPNKYLGLSDTYYIMRAHEGVSTLLEDLDDDPNTITISTGQFSTYALMYNDTPLLVQAFEADNCFIHWIILLIALAGIVFVYVNRKNRKSVYIIDAISGMIMLILVIRGACGLDYLALAAGIIALFAATLAADDTEKETIEE